MHGAVCMLYHGKTTVYIELTVVAMAHRIEKVKKCESLQEDELKTLCEYVSMWIGFKHKDSVSSRTEPLQVCVFGCAQVKEILVEESNVQPVNAPVTVSCEGGPDFNSKA